MCHDNALHPFSQHPSSSPLILLAPSAPALLLLQVDHDGQYVMFVHKRFNRPIRTRPQGESAGRPSLACCCLQLTCLRLGQQCPMSCLACRWLFWAGLPASLLRSGARPLSRGPQKGGGTLFLHAIANIK